MLAPNVIIDEEHVWTQVFESAKRFSTPRPTLFLDRDGVIVEEVHYLHEVDKVKLIQGAAQLIAKANACEIPVIVVTNQAGLARDYFGWDEFSAVQDEMLRQLGQESGAFIDAVYASPYHKSGKEPYRHPSHESRKPNPGMLVRAMGALPIQKSGSWIIGDKAGDLAAGQNAGLSGGIHVLTGHGVDEGERENAQALEAQTFSVVCADGIWQAIDILSPQWATKGS